MARPIKVLFTAAPGVIVWPTGSLQVEATVPSVALYSLAAVVEEAGFECTVLDPVDYWRRYRTDEQLAAVVQGHDVVCLSANTTTWPMAIPLIDHVAAHEPRPTIIVGGLHPTYCDKHVLETSKVDVVVRGEGEKTLPELLRAIADGAPLDDIHGLTFRRDERTVRTPDRPPLSCDELTEAPLPLWDRLPPMAYGFIPVELSRGCRFGCTFCSIYHQHRWRPYDGTVERIRHAASFLPIVRFRTLMFSDDCFTTDAHRVELIATAFNEAAPDIATGIEARAGDVLDPRVLQGLRKMNVEFIQIGVECGYPEGLRRIKKGITIDQAIASAHALHAAGLRAEAKYSYIVGFPWETARDMKRTMAFAMSLASRYGNHLQINWHMVVPGSAIYDEMHAEDRVSAADFDAFPPEGPDLFFRTHPSIDGVVAGDIQDYASILEQGFPWVATLGNVFRSWTRHAHLPVDRTTPAHGRDAQNNTDRTVSFVGTCWEHLPPVLRSAQGRE